VGKPLWAFELKNNAQIKLEMRQDRREDKVEFAGSMKNDCFHCSAPSAVFSDVVLSQLETMGLIYNCTGF
jgi:hypothetical protein